MQDPAWASANTGSVRIEVGRFLGLGSKRFEVNADKIEPLADRQTPA